MCEKKQIEPIYKFFIFSCIILTLAIININTSPCISHLFIYKNKDWPLDNCEAIKDELDNMDIDHYDYNKKKFELAMCQDKKVMYNFEHVSFIINLTIGGVCSFLGLYYIQIRIIPKIGIIGMALGGVGFVLTLVYVIYNGIVYTNYYNYKKIYKINEKGAYAEKSGDNYKCLFFSKENDTLALIAKFSDLTQSIYNYDKEMRDIFSNDNNEQYYCNEYKCSPSDCAKTGYIKGPIKYNKNDIELECNYLYYYKSYDDYENYELSARFLTCLILSIFSMLCYCSLGYYGFLLFK